MQGVLFSMDLLILQSSVTNFVVKFAHLLQYATLSMENFIPKLQQQQQQQQQQLFTALCPELLG